MNDILYLEDDAALAFVTKRALEKRGYNVDLSSSIESARANLSRVTYRYALLDLKIGNETSLDLIKDIKKLQNIPIVLLTGYGSIRTAVQAMKLGAVNFLSKPCSLMEIIAALEDKVVDPHQNTHEQVTPLSLRKLEWEAIQKALDENEGNISATARQLKMHRRTLQRKLQKKHFEP